MKIIPKVGMQFELNGEERVLETGEEADVTPEELEYIKKHFVSYAEEDVTRSNPLPAFELPEILG